MSKPASKPVIAVDIDDVLGLSADEFIRYTNEKWGTNLTIEDYSEHWGEVWKIDNQQEAERRMHEYIQYANPLVKKNPDAIGVLTRLAKDYKLVITTSRLLLYQNETRDWLETHFGNLFSEIHYAKRLDDNLRKISASKTEVLNEVGAQYLIDDQPHHCIAAAEAGIKTILFGNYAWNRHIKLQPNMVRAKNWQEVAEYFNGQAGK